MPDRRALPSAERPRELLIPDSIITADKEILRRGHSGWFVWIRCAGESDETIRRKLQAADRVDRKAQRVADDFEDTMRRVRERTQAGDAEASRFYATIISDLADDVRARSRRPPYHDRHD